MSAKVETDPVDSDEEEEVVKETPEEVEEVEDTTLANSDVVTKYQEAARIVQAVMAEIEALCVEGATLLSIATAGDNSIIEKTSAIFRGKNKKGKSIDRGIAFPVCISVNEVVCHYSPLASEDKLPPLVVGDVVKIDLGAHVDGYIAVGAHTVVVGSVAGVPIVGPLADAMAAAWTAAEVAAALIRPGNTNVQVTEAMKKVTEAYNVRAISGTVMHEMKRFVIDGKKNILLRADGDERVDACTFEQNEVYSIDIAVSSGEGKPRASDLRTTIFKRQVDRKYGLKVKASRIFFNDINKRFPTMPFSTRYLADETAAKMGVRECVTHELLASYPVLLERTGDQVAHVKFTVLLMPGGSLKITGMPRPSNLASDKSLPEDIAAILSEESERAAKRQQKKNKKKKSASAAATEA